MENTQSTFDSVKKATNEASNGHSLERQSQI